MTQQPYIHHWTRLNMSGSSHCNLESPNLRIMAQALLPFFLNKLPNKGYAHHLCPMYISPNIFQSTQQSRGHNTSQEQRVPGLLTVVGFDQPHRLMVQGSTNKHVRCSRLYLVVSSFTTFVPSCWVSQP